MSFDELLSASNERGLPLLMLSALKTVDIERLSELMLQPVWVIVDHLYHCQDWIGAMAKINQVCTIKFIKVNAKFLQFTNARKNKNSYLYCKL